MAASEPTHSGIDLERLPNGPVSRSAHKPITIYMECTHTYHSDINTGIQRVVRNVLRNAPEVCAQYGMRIVPVIVENSQYRVVDAAPVLNGRSSAVSGGQPSAAWKRTVLTHTKNLLGKTLRYLRTLIAAALPFQGFTKFLLAPPSEFGLNRIVRNAVGALFGRGQKEPIGALIGHENGRPDSAGSAIDHTGDILLLLDSSWTAPLWPATKAFKRQGGTVIGVIYDLIPVSHAHACVPFLTTAFTQWLREYCLISDGTITISRSVQHQYEMYVQLCFSGKPSVLRAPVTHFHLGSDLDLTGKTGQPPSPRIAEVFASKVPTFLMVGSIEPRKNHAFVLDAFERLWATGHQVRLVMVGKQAWRTEDFLSRVNRHPRLKKDLFVFRDASDAELEQCYLGSSALVIASEIEGFGLPVVEAFRRELPVICSDIPVFREIGGDAVEYFDLDDPSSLAVAIETFCQSNRRPHLAPTWLTWRQSTEALFQSISEIADMHATSPTSSRTSGSGKVA